MNIFNGPLHSLVPLDKIISVPDNISIVGRIPNEYKVVVECSVCKEDSELFGIGLFISGINHLRTGKLPCGCSPTPKWNKDQQLLRMNRALYKTNFTLGEIHKYTGHNTKITLVCNKHGPWKSNMLSILQGRAGCVLCSTDGAGICVRKPDYFMIEQFMNTGCYVSGTLFERSNRKTSQGALNYWEVYCPVCDSWGQSTTSDLKKGCNCCDCKKDFRETYINLVKDGDIPIALKFGVTKNFPERLYRQNLKSVFTVENLYRWSYQDKASCVASELKAKQEIPTSLLNENEFKDGWTETCSISFLENLITIFSVNGTQI